jgi:hypothetical protein
MVIEEKKPDTSSSRKANFSSGGGITEGNITILPDKQNTRSF